MKYTQDIIIDLPREEVIRIFDNQENAFKWMEGLETWDPVSGEQGQEGAVSKMRFKMKKRELEIQETILKKELPERINFFFEAKGMENWNDNHFEAISAEQTKWTQSNVFKFKGMYKLMALMGSGMFKKQSMKSMTDFKNFAEKH